MATKSVVANVTTIANRQRAKVKDGKVNKTNIKYPTQRLPFVERNPGSGNNFWNIPKCDGYGTGCDMGKAAARAFMKALRAESEGSGGTLQCIVIDMIKNGMNPEHDGDKGTLVGFFSVLDQWLVAATKEFGSSLDKISEQQLEQEMTTAANETEAENSKRYEVWVKMRSA